MCGHAENNEHMRCFRECLQREDSTGIWEDKEEAEKETGSNQKGGSSTSNFY